MSTGYPVAEGASLTTTQPGLGFGAKKSAPGPKLAIANSLPEQQHVPITSPGGIVMSGGYLGRSVRINERE